MNTSEKDGWVDPAAAVLAQKRAGKVKWVRLTYGIDGRCGRVFGELDKA